MHSFKAALYCYVSSALVLHYKVSFGAEQYDNIKCNIFFPRNINCLTTTNPCYAEFIVLLKILIYFSLFKVTPFEHCDV